MAKKPGGRPSSQDFEFIPGGECDFVDPDDVDPFGLNSASTGFGGDNVDSDEWYKDPLGGMRGDPTGPGGGAAGGKANRAMSQESTQTISHTVHGVRWDGKKGDVTVKTKLHDYAIAAINPDLANLNHASYKKRFTPKSQGGQSNTITFKDLASWELWARTDPMHTGTMHYVAMVLPGCGNRKKNDKNEEECVGAGDVSLEFCAWAKKGLSNTDDYSVDPGAGNSCRTHAPWMAGGNANPDYRRSCGPPHESPLIVGTTFQNKYDEVQKLLEKLRDVAWTIEDILNGRYVFGYTHYGLSSGRNGGALFADYPNYAEKREEMVNAWQDLTGESLANDRHNTYVANKFDWKTGTPTAGGFEDQATLTLIGIGAAGPNIDWLEPRPEWEFYEEGYQQCRALRLDLLQQIAVQAQDTFPSIDNAAEAIRRYTKRTHFGNWHNQASGHIDRVLDKEARKLSGFAAASVQRYRQATIVYNDLLRQLSSAMQNNGQLDLMNYTLRVPENDLQAYNIPYPDDFETFTERHKDDVRDILKIGPKPIIGKVTSDIPGTTVMGVEINGNEPDACVNNCNPDRQEGIAGNHSGNGGFPLTGSNGNNFGSFGTKDGTNRDGTPRAPGASFNSQAGVSPRSSSNKTCDDGMLWPSYAPSMAYDPTQQETGYSASNQQQASKRHYGNTINGNDVRIVENCLIRAKNAPAINNEVKQRPEGVGRWANWASGLQGSRQVGYISRTMSVLMRNNVIVHEFASSAYPVESGMFPSDNSSSNYNIPKGAGFNHGQPISNDVSLELDPLLAPINTLGATYVQSTRTLTASGEWGRHIPSWVKRGSKIMFHTPHACSGVSYTVEQRVSSSGLVLSAASNPGSDVGPGAIFDLRPKLYSGPVQIPGVKRAGYSMSPITVKNVASQGAQLEVWMQNNTIMAHPDACLEENDTQLGALRRGHNPGTGKLQNYGSMTGGPGTSGYLKSFTPKYIAVANIAMKGPVVNPHKTLYSYSSQTGWLESQVYVNMENNLICPVYNARLPSGKTYADDVTASSPKWDVVSDIGIPVINVVGSGCVVSHGSVLGNVIVGRTVFDTDKNQYVQHPDDGDNILAAMDHTDNSGHTHLIPSGTMGYKWPFASGFSVYDGGPDDVFRSFYGPFYGDNLSDKHLSVTGKGDHMDSFTRQHSNTLQFSLNEDVLFAEGIKSAVIVKTLAGLPPEVHQFGKMPDFDFGNTSLLSSSRMNPTRFIPESVVRPKFSTMKKPDSLEFGEKSIIDSKKGSEVKSTTNVTINKPRHVGACIPPLSVEQEEKRRIPNPAANINILGTVGQKKSNIKNGVYVNIDNSFNPAGSFPEIYGDRLKPDVIDYPNGYMPVTQGGLRVSSGGKNDKPVIGLNDLNDVEIHLGQTRDNVVENEKAASNIDKLYHRFKSQNGDGTQQ